MFVYLVPEIIISKSLCWVHTKYKEKLYIVSLTLDYSEYFLFELYNTSTRCEVNRIKLVVNRFYLFKFGVNTA